MLIAVGMVGATVMPHNLFLHSGLILTRVGDSRGDRHLCRRAAAETVLALNLALLVNAAILVIAATTFHPAGQAVDGLTKAHHTLDPLLGPAVSTVFALALLAAGLASSITGSLAGQLVLDGFLGLRIPLLARRVATMVPAVAVLAAGVGEITALLWSRSCCAWCCRSPPARCCGWPPTGR